MALNAKKALFDQCWYNEYAEEFITDLRKKEARRIPFKYQAPQTVLELDAIYDMCLMDENEKAGARVYKVCLLDVKPSLVAAACIAAARQAVRLSSRWPTALENATTYQYEDLEPFVMLLMRRANIKVARRNKRKSTESSDDGYESDDSFTNNLEDSNGQRSSKRKQITLYKNISTHKQANKYNHTSVYKLKCNTCNNFYIGQTGRSFQTRYKEHITAITKLQNTSTYAEMPTTPTETSTQTWKYCTSNQKARNSTH
ncbi:hypothetical protein ANN_00805 [Periplaneta americana]|uniref:Cyclin C-terminal domain-containing protein n=1 Tax=Periplaneta americana TaxID=6978 RepID=A0ABQ8TTI5_PERAM|nr:hypothetical protein ANN_00805 [Periplaneta americana]